MAWHVKFQSDSLRDWGRLPEEIREQFDALLDAAEDDPFALGAKKMGNISAGYRLRVDDYRLVFRLMDGNVLKVIAVGPRESVYARLPGPPRIANPATPGTTRRVTLRKR